MQFETNAVLFYLIFYVVKYVVAFVAIFMIMIITIYIHLFRIMIYFNNFSKFRWMKESIHSKDKKMFFLT